MQLAQLLEKYYEWSSRQERIIFDWVDPNGGYKLNPYQHYPLANFASIFAICCGYIACVVVGTWIMKSPKIPAFNTSMIQFFYNPLQIIVCSYMCVEAAIQAYENNYTILPCNKFNSEKPVITKVLYLFYLSKILDFMDTFLIIAGKKWKQLSVLHVYHHASVAFVYYADFRVAWDGDIYPTIVLNGFIHTIMYTYYFVSAHTREIWWKKYLTTLQLIQFVAMNVQGSMIVTRQCQDFPRKIAYMYLVYVQSLFWLFMNFFIRAYMMRPSEQTQRHGVKKQLESLQQNQTSCAIQEGENPSQNATFTCCQEERDSIPPLQQKKQV